MFIFRVANLCKKIVCSLVMCPNRFNLINLLILISFLFLPTYSIITKKLRRTALCFSNRQKYRHLFRVNLYLLLMSLSSSFCWLTLSCDLILLLQINNKVIYNTVINTMMPVPYSATVDNETPPLNVTSFVDTGPL